MAGAFGPTLIISRVINTKKYIFINEKRDLRTMRYIEKNVSRVYCIKIHFGSMRQLYPQCRYRPQKEQVLKRPGRGTVPPLSHAQTLEPTLSLPHPACLGVSLGRGGAPPVRR